jgi:hypothetical protein
VLPLSIGDGELCDTALTRREELRVLRDLQERTRQAHS